MMSLKIIGCLRRGASTDLLPLIMLQQFAAPAALNASARRLSMIAQIDGPSDGPIDR
ncbi:MAG: hypothetical protein Tsb0027_17930 [Wenzhouxiangellaceae bacterium]